MLLGKKLEENIVMIVESLGFEVYDIEYGSSRIAVYIDKENGVSIGDCENVSKNVSVILDVEDPFAHSYTLEVSSPGVNRKLKRIKHFEKAIGKRCVVKTHNAIGSSKVFIGILKDCNEDGIVINVEEGDVNIEFLNIKNARIDEKI